MTTSTIKLTLEGYTGAAYALYRGGVLVQCINEIGMDYEKDESSHMPMIPLYQLDLTYTKFIQEELKPRTVAEKVAMFCLKYKQHKGQPYRAMKQEKANLRTVTVNDVLLDTYFSTASYPLNSSKTMADYTRHFNTIRDLSANGRAVKSEFPAVYDREYEKRISDDVSKLQRYWSHLRSLGWFKDDGVWKQTQPS